MKNLILVLLSTLSILYADTAQAQTNSDHVVDDGTILVDDSYAGQQTSIEVRGGGLYINGIKVSDLDEATQLKIVKRGSAVASAASGDRDATMRFRVFNKAMLGVGVEDARPSIRILNVVEGSAADRAGLRTGDIITAIDEEDVKDFTDLTKIMARHDVGDKINIAFYRNNVLNKLTAKLTENTQMDRLEASTDIYPIPFQQVETLFDIPLNDFMMSAYPINLRPRLGIDIVENPNGLEVVALDSAGIADKAGIQVGDIIKMVKGREVRNLRMFETELNKYSTEERLDLTVFQGGEKRVISLVVPQIKRQGSF